MIFFIIGIDHLWRAYSIFTAGYMGQIYGATELNKLIDWRTQKY